MNSFLNLSSVLLISLVAFYMASCSGKSTSQEEVEIIGQIEDTLSYDGEKHLANFRQLTFGGDNAEAYWSFDNTRLTLQSNYKEWGVECDQIFTIDIDEPAHERPSMISTGLGRTTCSYFLPGDTLIVYSSTHLGGDPCPDPPPSIEGKYLWPVYDTYDIFVADLDGNIVSQLTNSAGYDAEPTVSPRGDRIVFTSTRSGDLELWTMNIDGTDKKQITDQLGYDGGAFFSPDGSKIIFRASRPESVEAAEEYKSFLNQGLVAPTAMELFICNADGSDLRQITDLGGANWAPFFHPSGEKVIFSSNHHGSRGFQFNLFMIDIDGNNLEQVTFDPVFDSFPMFSPDGTKIVFSSNRNNGGTRDTNVFVADWID